MPQATDTREQIIEHAASLLMQRGYNGFSYRDIATRLGVKNAAVHYHFPSKADLALALVEQHNDMLHELTHHFMTHGGRALPQLEGLFAYTRKQFCNGRCICPTGALAVDFEELPEVVKSAIERFMINSARWLTRVLEVGRAQGEFHFQGESRQRAQLILAALQGARQIARIRGQQVLDNVIQETCNTLGIAA
jgi:TetR/AcrR family transcriptional repressor of nem operon